VTHDRHECNKVFCANYMQNRDVGHLCYMRPLKDMLPDASEKVLYVFYDFETTQTTKYSDKATLHVPDLVCVEQFCSQCEDAEDCGECVRCGQRMHTFRDDRWGSCNFTYASHAHGPIRFSGLRIMPKPSTYISF